MKRKCTGGIRMTKGSGVVVGQKCPAHSGFGWNAVFPIGWNQVCTHSFYFLIDFSFGMTSFFEHQRSSFKKSYMRNLISLASADGQLDDRETSIIVNIGKIRGLKEWQIDELLVDKSEGHELFLPDSGPNRMNLLFDFMQIIYADGLVSAQEVSFIRITLEKFNLRPEIADHLVDLFQYGKPTPQEWNDFVDYINKVFINQETHEDL
jgi:uncharacterized tellurite resistance protein B-like protein